MNIDTFQWIVFGFGFLVWLISVNFKMETYLAVLLALIGISLEILSLSRFKQLWINLLPWLSK